MHDELTIRVGKTEPSNEWKAMGNTLYFPDGTWLAMPGAADLVGHLHDMATTHLRQQLEGQREFIESQLHELRDLLRQEARVRHTMALSSSWRQHRQADNLHDSVMKQLDRMLAVRDADTAPLVAELAGYLKASGNGHCLPGAWRMVEGVWMLTGPWGCYPTERTDKRGIDALRAEVEAWRVRGGPPA